MSWFLMASAFDQTQEKEHISTPNQWNNVMWIIVDQDRILRSYDDFLYF